MFQDPLSEGQVYWGRLLTILAVAATVAYVASQL